MPLVLGHEIPDLPAVRADGLHHLLRLAQRHARIVLALHDEQGFAHARRVIRRRDFFEERPHLRIPFVAVFHTPQIAPVILRVLEERHEVRDAHDIHAAAQLLAVVHHRRQHHVAAVAAADHREAPAVAARVALEPLDHRADVLHGILAFETIVEREKRFPVTRRTAHVRIHQRDSEFVQIIIEPRLKARMRLPLGSAVNAYQHRARPRKARGIRPVNNRRNAQPIEALQLHHLWLDERRGIQSARLALRPALDFSRRDRERINVVGRLRRTEIERQFASVVVPLQPRDRSQRQLRRGQFPRGFRVEQVEHSDPVLIGHKRDHRAVGRDLELIHVPRNVRRQRRMFARRDIDLHEAAKLRVLVRRGENRQRIRGKTRAAVRHFFAALLRENRARARLRVREIQVALIDRNIFEQQQLRVVLRPIRDAPAAARDLDQRAVRLGIARVQQVNVIVAPVARRRGVGEQLAAVRPAPPGVTRLAIRQQRDASIHQIVAIELVKFPAALVLRKHNELARRRLIRTARDRLGQKRQLLPRAPRHLHVMQLRRVREARRDQHLAPHRMPPVKHRAAKFQIARDRSA